MAPRFQFILLLLVFSISSYAQTRYDFKTGLAVPNCHRYGREAIATDQLTYLLATRQLNKPQEGTALSAGDTARWQKIDVDSTGKFRGNALANGYIYLTYDAPRAGNAVLNITGNSMCYFNGEPRGGDIYSDGWMDIPVALKKGVNEILIRCGNFSRWQGVHAQLILSPGKIQMKTDDATLPHIVLGRSKGNLLAAVVVVNDSGESLRDLVLTADLDGKSVTTNAPEIPPHTIRKIPFHFDPSNISSKRNHVCKLQLKRKGNVLDEKSLTIPAVNPEDHHSYTFISEIDGSVQYYSVAPSMGADTLRPAMFLSVHGAGVQAIGQARAYKPKDWGVLVAPTNRRPRGFNWEDWGRIDALEVLELATSRFQPDPERIYLTGHSMGGHGTWYLGSTYPDKWAAIAPCAGYPTLTGYGSADGRIPDSARSDMEQTLLRASNASNVIALAKNYSNHGVYIFHGDADRTVPVTFARQMRDLLGKFHPDFSYYEYPGGSHWFGNESVDWPPLFDYFRWHTLRADSTVDRINFVTANPGVSASFRWATIVQQNRPLEFSEINIARDRKENTITGTTANVAMLKLDLTGHKSGSKLSITLDSSELEYVVSNEPQIFLTHGSTGWAIGSEPGAKGKNPIRAGTFKDGFNHRMVFVYGTSGNPEEDKWSYNKARFDAEVWYYRGNGAVDIVADRVFDPAKYPDRGVILYGNASNNSAWNKLLANCPIRVTRDLISLGARTITGNDLAAYFIWPRADSNSASVAVISGTGLTGLHATEANQYFAAGSGFPDYMIFSTEMLKSGAGGIKEAGFFDNEWRLRQE